MSKVNLHNYEIFLIDYLDGNLSTDAIIDLKKFLLANPQLDIDFNDLDLPKFNNESVKFNNKNNLKKTDVFLEDEEILNYLENTLNDIQRSTIELNLSKNNLLQDKLIAYKKTILKPELAITFPERKNLLKNEDDLILSNTALQYVEQQLSDSDVLKFNRELKNNSKLHKELDLFYKTKLVPDKTIVFANKLKLKKENKVVWLFNLQTTFSIAAAILFLIGLIFIFNYYNPKSASTHEVAVKNNVALTKKKSIKSIAPIKNVLRLDSNEEKLISENKIDTDKKIKRNRDSTVYLITTNTTVQVVENNAEIKDSTIYESTTNLKTIALNKSDSLNNKIATTNLKTTKFSNQNIIVSEDAEEEFFNPIPGKNTFWKKAIKIAKQVNRLGVKSINGEETKHKNYALSFNSFSVEKH